MHSHSHSLFQRFLDWVGYRSGLMLMLVLCLLQNVACTTTYHGAPEIIDAGATGLPRVETGLATGRGAQPVSAIEQLLAEARTAMADQQYDRAAAMIERAIRVGPEDPRGYLELAKVRSEQGQYDQVAPLLARAKSLAGGNAALLRAIEQLQQKAVIGGA